MAHNREWEICLKTADNEAIFAMHLWQTEHCPKFNCVELRGHSVHNSSLLFQFTNCMFNIQQINAQWLKPYALLIRMVFFHYAGETLR